MTQTRKRILALTALAALAAALLAGYFWLWPRLIPIGEFGFARQLPEGEMALRTRLVQTACAWLGADERDLSHAQIIDLYNTQDPLPRGYTVTYTDAWCATFGSAVAMQCGLTDIIPTECSCFQQIGLFQKLGRWEEDDAYLPLPGDYIFYDWDFQRSFDCTGVPEHVGIVVGTSGRWILVMEGNKDGRAEYRRIRQNDSSIRGYGLPDYASKAEGTP